MRLSIVYKVAKHVLQSVNQNIDERHTIDDKGKSMVDTGRNKGRQEFETSTQTPVMQDIVQQSSTASVPPFVKVQSNSPGET